MTARTGRQRQASWNEPIIMEMSVPGERGFIPPGLDPEMGAPESDALGAVVGATAGVAGRDGTTGSERSVAEMIPAGIRRVAPPCLPEMAQPRVLRHYTRLSQEVLGNDVSIDIGKGTCTLKYSPKVNERAARLPEMADIHPSQPEETVQGTLQIMYEFEQMMKVISGMDRFSFQPGGGSQAIYANARLFRAYHGKRGEGAVRDEVITTVFSHPVNAACPATAGYRVITLLPGDKGYPDLDSLKGALSERTAGFMVTNPEDTGIFNPEIDKFVQAVHDAGGLCAYDQANANGILGMTRARDAGFDLCHFNLHKTFSGPHGSGGPGAAAMGASAVLAGFLPVPLVERRGGAYRLVYDLPDSIGKVRAYHGAVQGVLRAYMWVLSLGAEGLREVAETAVLNNNYVLKKMLEVPGVGIPYADRRRIEQVRYTFAKMLEDTGVSTHDVRRRIPDLVTHYWTSHHPFLVPEPATIEPTESYSKQDLDEYVAAIRQVSDEAYASPEFVKTAPHDSTIHRIREEPLDDPGMWAMTWRGYQRKKVRGAYAGAGASGGTADGQDPS